MSTQKGHELVSLVKSILFNRDFSELEVEDVSDLRPNSFTKSEVSVDGVRCKWKNDIIVKVGNCRIILVECKNPDGKNKTNVEISVWEVISKFFDLRRSEFELVAIWNEAALGHVKKMRKGGIAELITKDLRAAAISPRELDDLLATQV